MNCHDHGALDAVVYCESCVTGWCAPCGRRGNVMTPVCKLCGTKLGGLPRATHRADAGDFAGRLLSTESLIMAAIFGVIGVVVDFMSSGMAIGGVIVRVVYLALVVGYYFNIIHHVGAGRSGMPGPADDNFDFTSIFGQAVRGLVCFAVGLAPLLVWLFGFHHWGSFEHEVGMAVSMLVIGQLYMPAVLLSVTFGNHTANALWPPAWIQVIARAPSSYAAFAALWVATIFVGGALVGALQAIAQLIPVAGIALSATLGSLFWFAQAILIGLFIRRNADVFGWS